MSLNWFKSSKAQCTTQPQQTNQNPNQVVRRSPINLNIKPKLKVCSKCIAKMLPKRANNRVHAVAAADGYDSDTFQVNWVGRNTGRRDGLAHVDITYVSPVTCALLI